MGKRSHFPRRDRDAYADSGNGSGALDSASARDSHFCRTVLRDMAISCGTWKSHGLRCTYQGDIATGQDALALESYGGADAIITNPPWRRSLLHPLIRHFQKIAPTWLLLDQDWAAPSRQRPISRAAPTSSPSDA